MADSKTPMMTNDTMDTSAEMSNSEIPQHIAQSEVQTLLVHYTNWMASKVKVTDSITNEILYTVEFKMKKPHLRFYVHEETESFGTAIIHTLKPRIEVDLRGQGLEMKPKSYFSYEYSYTSPAFQNQKVRWRSHSGWKSLDYVCLDENDMPIARIVAGGSWGKKLGRMELLGDVGNNHAAKEELLVTGLTLTWWALTVQNSVNASVVTSVA